jgi:hypothetical protein
MARRARGPRGARAWSRSEAKLKALRETLDASIAEGGSLTDEDALAKKAVDCAVSLNHPIRRADTERGAVGARRAKPCGRCPRTSGHGPACRA